MATGPEHYREAEQHLENAVRNVAGSDAERWNLAAAQVHATLAVAAASALNDGETGTPHADWRAWMAAASTDISFKTVEE